MSICLHQVSHRVHTDTDDQRKASTLPRRHERSRVGDGPKSPKTETETSSKADAKHPQEKLGKSSESDPHLLETVAKVTTAFETETIIYDATYDATRGKGEASKYEDVCEPVRGSAGPVFRRGRRSRPSVVGGRRSSAVAVARRGKAAAARKPPSSGRVPPVGAAATPVRADGPAWMTCLDERDSDEDSYVTACNSTPLLSRAFPFSRKDDASQLPDNNRKSHQTGNSGGTRRRRRRFKSPGAYDAVGGEETPTIDQPAPQATLPETSTIMYLPIPVIVVLLFLYVLGGAVMFRQLYGVRDWSTAAYISLAAMLTVGGWYPDRRTDDTAVGSWTWWPPDARFVYAMWVVVGLAMVSACLRLTIQTLSYCTSICRRSQSTARSQP